MDQFFRNFLCFVYVILQNGIEMKWWNVYDKLVLKGDCRCHQFTGIKIDFIYLRKKCVLQRHQMFAAKPGLKNRHYLLTPKLIANFFFGKD